MAQRSWQEVRDEERRAIDRRRAAQEMAPGPPSAGLAFSGGGIRSATFGLGVLEALKERDLLRRFDYVSSVSGGGYIMSWLTANCWRWRQRHGAAAARGGGWLAPSADWSESIRHLSRHSNYLSPQVGLLSADTWSMATVWMRNTILVQSLVIALIACLLAAPPFLSDLFRYWPAAENWRWATVGLFVLAVTGVAANQLQLRHREPLWLRLRPQAWFGGLLCLAVLVLAMSGLWLDTGFDPWQSGKVSMTAFPIAALIMFAALSAVPLFQRLLPRVLSAVPLLQRLFGVVRLGCSVNYGQVATQWLVVIPLLLTAVLVSAVLWGVSTDRSPGMVEFRQAGSYGALVAQAWRYWPFPLSFAFDSFLLFGICALQSWDREKGRRAFWGRWTNVLVVPGAALVCAGLLHLLLCGVVLLMRYFDGLDGGVWHAFVWTPPLLLVVFALCVTFLIGLLGRASLEGLREWWSRLAAWLCIYAFGWSAITIGAVYGPFAVMWLLDYDGWASLVPVGGWLLTTLGGLLAARSPRTGHDDKTRSSQPSKTSSVLEAVAILAPYVFLVGVIVLVATALHVLLMFLGRDMGSWPPVFDVSLYWHRVEIDKGVRAGVLAACAALLFILAWRVDINEFGLNQFYRNRLVRCYLGATRHPDDRNPQAFTQFDEQDDLGMPCLAGYTEEHVPGRQADLAGPLHIINCALNLGGTRDLALHTRHSATFVITPFVLGSGYFDRDGGTTPAYRSHEDYMDGGKPVTLGQAAAVSGAAASPNMGFHTSPIVAFMMTMFNARLGWWFPNPSVNQRLRPSPLFSLRYLVMELFGAANERSNYLMVSDGGHFENLGVYELVRRRCGLIVAVDAECDRDMTFGALGTLIRICAADFGARIDIGIDNLERDAESGWSPAHGVIGTITYADDSQGMLVYLKASQTGKEPDASIRQYRATHGDYPHESTGDQFYGEDQFESYRRLGRHVAATVFDTGMSEEQRDLLRGVWPIV